MKDRHGTGQTTGDVDPQSFRQALSRLAGGIVVVTALDETGGPVGLTATSVCSVSLRPPLVLVCLGWETRTHDGIRATGRYAINVLGARHRELSERFASTDAAKFEGLEWRRGVHGCPILEDSIAVCECEVEREVEAGDHTIFIGRVVEATAAGEGAAPLLWYRGGFRELTGGEER